MADDGRRDPIRFHARSGGGGRGGSGSGTLRRDGAAADAARGTLRRDGVGVGAGGPVGELMRFEGEDYYRISSYQLMPPFLMTLASDSDLWMFVTSGGGLTAGRVDADGSIFPYETVDKLHHAQYHTGPVTLLRARRADGKVAAWEPFSGSRPGPGIDRNLYKNATGNRVVFEEVNGDLGLAFRYRWAGCEEFGWVRTATLENRGELPVAVEFLDGLRDVLPYGVSQALYQSASNLADAYKRSEVEETTSLGIFSLTAGISDRPEAIEVLRANTVWTTGLEDTSVHLSEEAVDAFRAGERPPAETVLTGRRGNYLVSAQVELGPTEYAQWHTVADSGRSHAQIARLVHLIVTDRNLAWEIEASLARAGENIRRIVGSSDGIQKSARAEVAVHHFANVLFNDMRGGVFAYNHEVPAADLAAFMALRNRATAERQKAFLDALPETVGAAELLRSAARTGDADLQRLCHEYLPIYFGRRHGDPSRPWNRFTIHVRSGDGSRALNYEGNWRDIFQNWEALCASFPGFLQNVVAKFVNASTVDGFNPYRISREGVDWEVPDPDDPWSHIGYWGDHQIVYLLKLLEAMTRYMPGGLEDMLHREVFSYADVPYRIRPYEDIVKDPTATIDFDAAADEEIGRRVSEIGTDGKLVPAADGGVYHVNLFEKLLVPLLSKLSNLVPDGGIWLNTQRPEWNDANNALVGNGVSVVTLCYVRRYTAFLEDILAGVSGEELGVSSEVVRWFRDVRSALGRSEHLLAVGPIGDRDRKRIMDELGTAFSDYRGGVYGRGFSRKEGLSTDEVVDLCRLARAFADHGIRANRRDDSLYNSYVLLEYDADGGAALRPLYEMLEGQVAVLSSGVPSSEESAEILDRLFSSDLYRADQKSFMLYPDRELPSFMDKNVVPSERASTVTLVRQSLEMGEESIVLRDASGAIRFHPDFRNVDDVAAALDTLSRRSEWGGLVARDRGPVLGLFEEVFKHDEYTGRSGAMYSYEGLGCIYWHMVAKLLVAAQEVALRATEDGSSETVRRRLAGSYERIRSGLGFAKTPREYGAFPTDPYSHTPRHGGAKQPGMTGQVKEEILTRLGELGVRVDGGRVAFRPILLDADEFLMEPAVFRFFDLKGDAASLELDAGSLAFTFCQVPVVYEAVDSKPSIRVSLEDGTTVDVRGDALDRELSRELFGRTEKISLIRVAVPKAPLE